MIGLLVIGAAVFFAEDLGYKSIMLERWGEFKTVSDEMTNGKMEEGKIKVAELKQRYAELEGDLEQLQKDLVEKKDQSVEKIEEVRSQIEAAKEAYGETKAALDKLSNAADGLQQAFEIESPEAISEEDPEEKTVDIAETDTK